MMLGVSLPLATRAIVSPARQEPTSFAHGAQIAPDSRGGASMGRRALRCAAVAAIAGAASLLSACYDTGYTTLRGTVYTPGYTIYSGYYEIDSPYDGPFVYYGPGYYVPGASVGVVGEVHYGLPLGPVYAPPRATVVVP